jgi:hypothetical protein
MSTNENARPAIALCRVRGMVLVAPPAAEAVRASQAAQNTVCSGRCPSSR